MADIPLMVRTALARVQVKVASDTQVSRDLATGAQVDAEAALDDATLALGVAASAEATADDAADDAAAALAAVAGKQNAFTINRTSEGGRTLALSDAWTMIAQSGAAARNYTLPDNATVAFPVGTRIKLGVVHSTGGINVNRAAGVILLYAGADANRALGYGDVAELVKTATDEWMISGSGIA